ncbi:MAG: hypothetical protein QOI95_3945 [Acidimicrobiaceae bacterium]
MTGWIKWWFLTSWCVGMLFAFIGIYFQVRNGKPSGSVPWGFPLFTGAWASGVAAAIYGKIWRQNSTG